MSINELQLIPDFYTSLESLSLYQQLSQSHRWPENAYNVAGRRFLLPRLQTWHADPGIVYSYSNNLLVTREWTTLLSSIRVKVETKLNFAFNSVLVNWYRNGADYVGWHADNEAELGNEPFIASISFGAERCLGYRRKDGSHSGELALPSGSLLVMQPAFQRDWQHCIPIDHQVQEGRINLTFRKVIPADSAR